MHCCTSHLCSHEGVRAAFNSTGQLSHTHTQSRPALEQQVSLQVAGDADGVEAMQDLRFRNAEFLVIFR